MPAHHIRVIATPNGGGFGGKSDPFNHEIVAAKAALVTGRPVKITLTREEVFYAHRGRHPVLMRLKTGVRQDGTIVAMDLETLLDGGATVPFVARYRKEATGSLDDAQLRTQAGPAHAAAFGLPVRLMIGQRPAGETRAGHRRSPSRRGRAGASGRSRRPGRACRSCR